MKNRRLLVSAVMLAVVSSFVWLPAKSVQAACSNVSSFGAVQMQVPELTNIQDQTVWLRMQGKAGDTVLVEINDDQCLEVKLSQDSLEQWVWQSLSGISFPSPTNNELKLIGTSSGVRIDRVLVVEPTCTPVDYGNNCESSVTLTNAGEAEPTALTPPEGSISGKVHISPTVQGSKKSINRVTYTVNGIVVQDEQTAAPFDTTLIENGQHTVYIKTTFADGTEVREMVAIEVNNPENALSPVVRWMKRNQSSLMVIGLGLLTLAGLLAAVKFVTGWRRSKRERTFRGL